MHPEIEALLRMEFERATRLRRPLSALVLVRPDLPIPLPGDQLERAAAAIANCTRAYDAAGLISERVLLVVLPESDTIGARVVADRLRAELAARDNGRRRWSVLEFAHVERLASPERFIEGARRLGAVSQAVA